jgi:hypothetical protein
MTKILIGLCALSFWAGLAPKISAQTVSITVGPATDDSHWIWNDEYQVWVWNGPEFQGDYQGHPYSYWHGRHEGSGDRSHRPGKGESSEGEHPVNKDVQPRVEIDRSKEAPPQAEVEKPKEQPPKPEVDKPKAAEKARTEKPQAEEKSKTEKPQPDEKKGDSKPKGE